MDCMRKKKKCLLPYVFLSVFLLDVFVLNGQITEIDIDTPFVDDHNFNPNCNETTFGSTGFWCTSSGVNIGNISTESPENGRFHGWFDYNYDENDRMSRTFSCNKYSNITIKWDILWNCCGSDDYYDGFYYYSDNNYSFSYRIASPLPSYSIIQIPPYYKAITTNIVNESTGVYNCTTGVAIKKVRLSSYIDNTSFVGIQPDETFTISFSMFSSLTHGAYIAINNIMVICNPSDYTTYEPSKHPTLSPSNNPILNPSNYNNSTLNPTTFTSINTSNHHTLSSTLIVSEKDTESLDIGVIIGIVIGCIVFCLLIVIIITFIWYNKSKIIEQDNRIIEIEANYGNSSGIPIVNVSSNNTNDIQSGIDVDNINLNNNIVAKGEGEADEDIDSKNVHKWLLMKCQLPEYYELFINAGYQSLDIVKLITKREDLKEIGINKIGHRSKIWEEIQILQNIIADKGATDK